MVKGIKSNENKNKPDVSKEKLEELGILKVLSIIISDEGEDKYKCIMEDGNKKVFLSSDLL